MDHITVLLVGGPVELVRQDCVHDVPSMAEQVKVAHCGGYEHYRYAGGSRRINGRTLPVYEWCARTKVAE